MAVPFRRTSKTKKRMRRTHLKKVARKVTLCPKCGAPIQPHRVCMACGYYNGKDVLNKETKEVAKEETKEAKVEEVKAPKKETTKKVTKKATPAKKTTAKKESK
jgi:large subunit ribosomal protein L32